MRAKVEKLLPSDTDNNSVGAVVMGGDGPTLAADFVIMGVGVAPATKFLKESGFTLERDGGVLVDEFLRVKGQEQNIYAIGISFQAVRCILSLTLPYVGDIAVFPQTETSEPRRIEHWNVCIVFLILWHRGLCV